MFHQFKKFGLPTGTKKGNRVRRAGLELLKKVRNNGGIKHLDWGTSELMIPELDFYVLCKRYPDLISPDAEISTKAWDKFLRSSASAPYRVRDTDKPGALRQSSIIVPENFKHG